MNVPAHLTNIKMILLKRGVDFASFKWYVEIIYYGLRVGFPQATINYYIDLLAPLSSGDDEEEIFCYLKDNYYVE